MTRSLERSESAITADLPTAGQDRAIWAGSVAIAGVIFSLVANRHWVPGGDSEVYVSTARSLLLHHFSLRGYLFNGQPINMFPPGWPYVLALAMKISPGFLFLKLIAMSCMLGSLAMAYPICRRFAPPIVCGIIIVLTALLSHVYPLTFWLHSDALFCLFTTASILVAIQIGEGRAQGWRIALVCVLCAAAVTVRWAGLLGWLVVAAAILDGRIDVLEGRLFEKSYWMELLQRLNRWLGRPAFSRYMTAAVLAWVATVGTFALWRTTLHLTEVQITAAKAAGGTEEGPAGDAMTKADYSFLNANDSGIRGYLARGVSWGDWYSFLFWQPFRFRVMNLLNVVSFLFGWAVLIPMLYQAWVGIRSGRWIWASLALYGFGLAMSWPHPVSRYLVPIVFLLFTAIWAGANSMAESWRAFRRPSHFLFAAFLVGFVLCNGALYGVEVWAQRSSDFYGTYEAGMNKDLIASADYLNSQHLKRTDGIAVSERYVNLSIHPHASKLGLRVIALLTGRPVITIPTRRYLRGPATQPTMGADNQMHAVPTPPAQDWMWDPDPANNLAFMNWARDSANNVKYYLYQPAVSPWRALHFRVGWLQERATHQPVTDSGAGWRLYRIPTTGPAERVLPLPDVADWPTVVPGVN